MKIIINLIISLLIVSCSSHKIIPIESYDNINKRYISAFNAIVNHKETQRLLDNAFGKNKYCFTVSNELIDFDNNTLNDFIEIIATQTSKGKEEVETELKNLIAQEPKDAINNGLPDLRNCKNPNMIIFFSNIEENVVLANAFGTNDLSKNYNDYPLDFFNLRLSFLIYLNDKGEVENIYMNGIWYGI